MQPKQQATSEPVVRYPVKLVTTSGSQRFAPGQALTEIVRLGFEYLGPNTSRVQRAELQGAPRFCGLVGPMWDGDALRYECAKTYEDLSR